LPHHPTSKKGRRVTRPINVKLTAIPTKTYNKVLENLKEYIE